MAYIRGPLALRFWDKVEKRSDDKCWPWLGAQKAPGTKHPYGQIFVGKGAVPLREATHRVSWLLYRGAIPCGMHVLHKCDNTLCVNPSHLFLGTHQQNMADMRQKGRAIGHPGVKHPGVKLTEENVRAIWRSKATYDTLAERFGVSDSLVWAIKKGRAWQHLGLNEERA